MGKSLAASADRCGPVGADIQDNPNCLYDPCIPSVSDRPCVSFPAGVCDRGPRPLHKGVLSGHGDNRACRLFAVFEGHREEEEEAVMKPDLEKTRAYYHNFSSENICDCDYCQNYCARVKAAYPEVARYLDSLGVDSKE